VKLIEIVADAGNADTVASIAESHEAMDFRLACKGEDGRQAMRMLIGDDKAQSVLDDLQSLLAAQPDARIIVLPVEAALPRPPKAQREDEPATATREALYDSISRNARLDGNYLLLVVLSTVVAAIGLIEDNVAVVIGAMVIAPLLGPNLALALGTALGDGPLMWKSLLTNIAGLTLAFLLAVAVGVLWPIEQPGPELLARTRVGLDAVALALASGAAAVLSIATGLPSVLVGVMVAVALMPPVVTIGVMVGSGNPDLAVGAALLLAVNVVCVNLAAKVVFLAKGIHPRTWWEKKKARRAMAVYLVVWVVSLLALIAAIYLRREGVGAP
jgi:uncharacterized hydrophobic protein (TIGR00341 family)